MPFQDQHHIEQIRQRLWRNREFGQAAVMVGSGFSRNAEKIAPNSPDFPLWWDLENQMRKELPTESISSDLDALELASEYEKTNGRQRLEEFLLKSIPDRQYNPGKLHELLLSLPWSDVFTTNYDTLLERTFVLDRKYDVIYKPADIPGRMKPRIVKLHGSFRSYRPFIFTQQDYESYPVKFAPFVNMVQQSIMENAFCLIGFSGEDPNFLKWIEWVRNNLNEYSPPIYLCGLLSISNYQKQILKERKVTTVDLSPLFPKSDWTNRSLRHFKALEWFLLSLMYGESPDLSDWLSKHDKTSKQIQWQPSEGLPNIPLPESLSSPSFLSVNSISQSPGRKKLLNNNQYGFPYSITEAGSDYILKTWEKNRREYELLKGWVIPPRKYRQRLWNYTQEWIPLIFNSLDKLPAPINLVLLYELNWRLEKSLTPLISDLWIEKISEVVDKFNPYPNILELDKATIKPNIKDFSQGSWSWSDIQQAWVGLIFGLLRAARENHDRELFNQWVNVLENIVTQNIEWQSRWYYERCLFHMCRLEHDLTSGIVEAWKLVTITDFWQVKRASILVQLGRLEEAQRIVQEALKNIRSCIQPDTVDYLLLSQEGWSMQLLIEIGQQIKLNQLQYEDESIEVHLKRWEKLERYKCDPNTELEILENAVSKPRPQYQNIKEVKGSFLPGRTTKIQRFGRESIYPKLRPAFESLRIFEEGGLPFGFSNIHWHNQHIINATKWSIPIFPTWSFLTLLQVSKAESVKEWLSFTDIAILPQEEVDYFFDVLYSFLLKVVRQLSYITAQQSYSYNYLDSKLSVITEATSYLCIRFNNKQINCLFDLTIKLYKTEAFRQAFCLKDCPGRLFKMLFYSMSQSDIISKFSILLALPIADSNGFEVETESYFTEPFAYLIDSSWSSDILNNLNTANLSWSDSIEQLLYTVENGSKIARRRACLRLSTLDDINALTSSDKDLFAQALWKYTASDSLPLNTPYLDHAFLILPEPKSGRAKDILKKKIIESFASLDDLGLGSNTSLNTIERYCNSLIRSTSTLHNSDNRRANYIDWSSEKAEYFLEQLYNWHDKYQDEISRLYQDKEDFLHDDLYRVLREIKTCLCIVILPRLSSSDEQNKQLAKSFIDKIEHSNVSALSILPMTLFIDPDADINYISKQLRLGLSSLDTETIDSAIIGIKYWLVCSQQEQIKVLPSELLNDLVIKIANRRQPRLNFAINQLANMLNLFPNILTQSQLESLLLSLEFILEEVKLPENWQEWKFFDENINTTIDIEARPDYMRLAAYLAFQLYQVFKNQESEMPQILIQFKETCMGSVFPEVRRVWSGE